MNIAIIGGGFCGIAAAWHLLHLIHGIKIKIFDRLPLGEGASGVAAGLLHPFVGAKSNLNKEGKEGVAAALKLLDIAAEEFGAPVYAPRKGILRVALSEEQRVSFKKCAEFYPEDAEWVSEEECHRRVPILSQAPGLFLKQGVTVYSKFYLQGLWRACEKKGAEWIVRSIQSMEEAQKLGDIVIWTTGASTQTISDLNQLPLKGVKGQLLELAWPSSLPPLPFTVNSHVYVVMSPDQQSCFAGSTYEKKFVDDKPDWDVALKEIMPKVAALLPGLKNAKPLQLYAGIRSVAPGHLPFLKQMGPRQWVLAGMGSKGLLYHALMAQKLANLILRTC